MKQYTSIYLNQEEAIIRGSQKATLSFAFDIMNFGKYPV
jgi:hypothetical protein